MKQKTVNVVSEPYCDGCPKWNPSRNKIVADTFVDDELAGDEIVIADFLECANRDLCKELYKQIEKYLKKKEVKKHENSRAEIKSWR